VAIGTVVFVPGLAGSELRVRFGFLGEVELWLHPGLLVGAGWGRMLLPLQEEGMGIEGSGGLIEGGPLNAFYGLLIGDLRQRGWTVVAPVADWRRSQAWDLLALTALLGSIANEGPVWIVCHSRGGLLVRRSLAALSALGLLGQVRRVVGLGVPHGGSLSAVQYLTQESPFVRAVHTMGKFVPGLIGELLSPAYIASVICSWQSLYELMPRPDYGWIESASVTPLYSAAKWEGLGLPIVSAYLTAALASWATVPAIPAGVEWVDVVGTGFSTPWRMPPAGKFGVPGWMGHTDRGDGLVPEGSAVYPGHRVIRTPTAHDWLPTDGRLYSHIHSVLLNGLTSDVTLTGGRLGF